MNKKIKIGLFGFGCVGQGFYDIFRKHNIQNAEISYICVRDKSKKRPLAENKFVFDKDIVFNDPEVDLIIELISDADEAFEIVKTALLKGMKVISANKKMIAHHLPELIEIQAKGYGTLLYEASTCGSIPIIRNLEDYFAFEEIKKLRGIFNGSSNFILNKLNKGGISYKDALTEAQDLGFAEADPLLDVGGFDALNKLCITIYHAFGAYIHPEDILNFGIQNITEIDNAYAAEKKWKVKQIAFASHSESGTIQAFVLPQFIENEEDLFHVDEEFNAASLETAFAGTQLLKGKGAGAYPTGSAVFSDYKAIIGGYNYKYSKENSHSKLNNEAVFKVYLRGNNEDLLKEAGLLSILEARMIGQSYYIIGEVDLSTLLKNKSFIDQSNIFVAALPDRLQNKKTIALIEQEEVI